MFLPTVDHLTIELLTPPPFSKVLLPATRSPRLRALPSSRKAELRAGTLLRLTMTIFEKRKDYLYLNGNNRIEAPIRALVYTY